MIDHDFAPPGCYASAAERDKAGTLCRGCCFSFDEDDGLPDCSNKSAVGCEGYDRHDGQDVIFLRRSEE